MRLIILLLTFIVISGCEPPPSPDCSGYSKEGTVHTWRGKIHDYSYMCFQWSEDDTLIIDSHGGKIWSAKSIINDVIYYKIHTVSGSYCASACVMIYSWGATRSVSGETVFGIHQTTDNKDELEMYNPEVDKLWLKEVMVPNKDLYLFYVDEAYYRNLATKL